MPSGTSAVFELVARITAASTVSGVWQTYMDGAKEAGFRHGIACFVNANGIGTVFGNTMPPGWLEAYANGLDAHDPLIARNNRFLVPYQWSLAELDPLLTEAQQQWREHNKAMGILGGYTILDRSDGDLRVIALIHDDIDSVDANARAALHFAGLEAMLHMQSLGLRPERAATALLSARESECLKWVADGKSDWEIGQILSLSEKTINVYVERAKQKMGAATRVQAVVRALRQREIAL